MKKTDSVTDEKFEEVMQYVSLRLKSGGTRLKVRDKEDLRELFLRLDANRKDKGSTKPRFSDEFIEKAINTNAAKKRYGTVIGSFGTVKTFRRDADGEARTLQNYKGQGKAVYRYEGGLAVKTSFKRGKSTVTKFRDTKTGHLLPKGTKFEEME